MDKKLLEEVIKTIKKNDVIYTYDQRNIDLAAIHEEIKTLKLEAQRLIKKEREALFVKRDARDEALLLGENSKDVRAAYTKVLSDHQITNAAITADLHTSLARCYERLKEIYGLPTQRKNAVAPKPRPILYQVKNSGLIQITRDQ